MQSTRMGRLAEQAENAQSKVDEYLTTINPEVVREGPCKGWRLDRARALDTNNPIFGTWPLSEWEDEASTLLESKSSETPSAAMALSDKTGSALLLDVPAFDLPRVRFNDKF